MGPLYKLAKYYTSLALGELLHINLDCTLGTKGSVIFNLLSVGGGILLIIAVVKFGVGVGAGVELFLLIKSTTLFRLRNRGFALVCLSTKNSTGYSC